MKAILLLLVMAALPAHAAIYYINTQAAYAAISTTTYAPGDQILLARGMTFYGKCKPLGSGSSGNPIKLGAYGIGARPVIDLNGQDKGIALWNQEYWEIADLEIRGPGMNVGTGDRWGIYIGGDIANNTLDYFRVVNCVVHNLGGVATNSHTGGITFVARGVSGQTFRDVVIDSCTVHSMRQWRGIMVNGNNNGVADPKSRDVYVRNCTVYATHGDGIILLGVLDGAVEDCVAYDCGQASSAQLVGPTPVAIWMWNSTNVRIDGCEAYGQRTPSGDGGGFDIDYHNTNCTVQYSYAHDNYAFGCAVYGADNNATVNSKVRYNIFSNNARVVSGSPDFLVATWNGGSIDGVQFYNNTSYWNPATSGYAVNVYGSFSGTNPNFFRNNLIYSTSPNLASVATTAFTLDHNLYWYTGSGNPNFFYNGVSYTSFAGYRSGSGQETNSKFADPLLNQPTYHGTGMPITQFTLQAGSPAIDAGTSFSAMGSLDFYANPAPQGVARDIGAHERTAGSVVVTVDNTDAGFSTDAAWPTSTSVAGYLGTNYAHDGTSGSDSGRWAKWTPNLPSAGSYEIFMRWTSGSTRPDAAPVHIAHAGGTDTSKTVNQTVNNGVWVSLGTYTFNAGTGSSVTLWATDVGWTVADGVKWESR